MSILDYYQDYNFFNYYNAMCQDDSEPWPWKRTHKMTPWQAWAYARARGVDLPVNVNVTSEVKVKR